MQKIAKPFWRREGKKKHYGCEQYKNLLEDKKQKLVEYRKKYKMRKSAFYNNKELLLKSNNLESSCEEEYKDVLKKQFWSYKFTSESYFKQKIAVKNWLKWKKENSKLKKQKNN